MNLVKVDIPIQEYSNDKINLSLFRKYEYEHKLDKILQDISSNIKGIIPDIKFDISQTPLSVKYQGITENYFNSINFDISYKTFLSKFFTYFPKLVDNNFFVINSVEYIPTLIMERNPVDLNIVNDKKRMVFIEMDVINHIIITINDGVKKKAEVKFNSFDIDFASFCEIFCNDKIKEKLSNRGFLKKRVSKEEALKNCIKGFGYSTTKYFDNNDFVDFINNKLVLPYFKELFKLNYGTDKYSDLVNIGIEYLLERSEHSLSNLKNRRVVFMEYLMIPYLRMYYDTIKKHLRDQNLNPLPNLNESTIVKNFTDIFGNKQQMNGAIPFAGLFYNKMSQKIFSISDKIPLGWRVTDDSQFLKICPLSVSSTDPGESLVGVANLNVDFYGRFL